MAAIDSAKHPPPVGGVQDPDPEAPNADNVDKGTTEGDSDSDFDAEENRGGMKLRELQSGEYSWLKREHWWQIWRPSKAPPRPRASLADAPEIPLATANIFSQLTFHWVSPLMRLGYQRPLQATDLWKVDASREADFLSEKFMAALEKRQRQAAEWNEKLPTAVPSRRQRLLWDIRAMRKLPADFDQFGTKEDSTPYAWRRRTLEAEWRERSGKRQGSIPWALNETFPGFWYAGLYKVIGDVSSLMSPLLVKAVINFSKETYAAHHGHGEEPNVGRGVGMALGMLFLTILTSLCTHQFFFRSMSMGALSRAALVSATYKRSLKLTVGARSEHPPGKLMAYLSSDISRIDYCCQWFHAIWTAPIQLIITLILLILQIGASALVGFCVFIILAPVQTWFMQTSFTVRKASMKWTDGRSKLLQEFLGSMQIIKVFTYEMPLLKRLGFVRGQELKGIRKILFIRAGNQALAFSVPAIAAVLSFVTYTSTHPGLDPALIFTSLAYFNLLRQPLMFLPRALSTLTDAQTAVQRLTVLFEADVVAERSLINPELDVAVRARNATFQWATTQEQDDMDEKGAKEAKEAKGAKGAKGHKGRKKDKKPVEKVDPEKTETEPFKIENLSLEIPRGRLVGIVGPVGSGKSSILQGLLGEMRSISGQVEFGGNLGYCPQQAWIQNATLRENILFGRKWDESRYWNCVQLACLIPDFEILADGDLTEIGEKGVNLSGGQKQRVNIARALYFDADIILFDDPLSAVDAHVGKALFNGAIMGLRKAGKTVVLVTHALHFLPQVDYIYTIQNGQIVEEGTYPALLASAGPFQHLMAEFGGSQAAAKEEEDAEEEAAIEEVSDPGSKTNQQKIAKLTSKVMGKAAGSGKLEGRLMVSEVRKTGSVDRKVYMAYLRAGKAFWTLPATLGFAVVMQTGNVLSTVWLTWWQADTFHRSTSFYQGMYAMLGLSSAIFTFGMGLAMGCMAYYASKNLYRGALRRVFFSPMSFFDTQPLGRIMGIFGKDIDTVDNQLADSLRMQAMTMMTLFGAVIIISVFFPVFLAIIFGVGIGYYYFALFYRTSAREVKRLDSMLRSLLYSHFSESLSGLATVRAYGETERFIQDNCYYMDLEDRAYLLTASNQRWLAVRLDFLGGLLVFAVAMLAVKGGGGMNASQIALCLTYIMQITQVLGMVTRQSAEVENNMNAVERIKYYSDGSLPQEASYEEDEVKPPADWPAQGAISFNNVVMSYREGLPAVLKGISADFQPGEKIGIIGRTGAGKTSITVALFRLAELTSGSILIDGEDISKLGLRTLRSNIAIIPQDPVLFSGTLRSNLDPFDQYSDAILYDAMKRAKLTDERDGKPRYTLDMAIDDEGSNLSIGERSLVSLARALVKDSRIVVLDEATAAVDMETDAVIQSTIRREFGSKTLLCIAHRLRTIISWDRILVMDAGEIESFDSPIALFDAGGLFRLMCERSNISREEIIRARNEEVFT